mgnify:CR=1 FL=1
MVDSNFNRKRCIKALGCIGFTLQNRRSGSHDKYVPPQAILRELNHTQPHFIMIPRHNELHCQAEIIAELRKMGGNSLVDAFIKFI